jgi:N-acetylneuraminate synthase
MTTKSNPKLLEIHLSYKDLELLPENYIVQPLETTLVVHAPELFAGDHTLDLCSFDDTYRTQSLFELQRVIDLTNKLKKYFPTSIKPCIVTNVGGFTETGHIDPEKKELLYETLQKSLSGLNLDGIEIIAQTMPPFPWHFGGQRFHNLFVDPADIKQFCKKTNMRICLDISHSKLACNHLKISFSKFLEQIMPFTAHLHLADASGIDGEGLQVKTGEIDWESFFDLYSKYCPKATFIPEIWQGHKNGGEGAWIALERLEKISKLQ